MNEDTLAKVTCGGLAFGIMSFTTALGIVVGGLWLSPPVGGTPEQMPDHARKQAVYEAEKADALSDLTAAEPDPFLWASDPEKAKRVMDRIQAERRALASPPGQK